MEYRMVLTIDDFNEVKDSIVPMCDAYIKSVDPNDEVTMPIIIREISYCIEHDDWYLYMFSSGRENKGFMIAKLMDNSVSPVLFIVHMYCPNGVRTLWETICRIARDLNVTEIQGQVNDIVYRCYQIFAGRENVKKMQTVRLFP